MIPARNACQAMDRWSDTAASIVAAGVLVPELPHASFALRCRSALQREFPHLPWVAPAVPPPDAVVVDEREWRDPTIDLYHWDTIVLGLQSQRGWLLVRPEVTAEPATETLLEVLTRYQRLAPRVNAHSHDEVFLCALSLHRTLHDLDKPLVRADYEHALDVWQWVLRLEPGASRALQLAALFHDIERLSSEPDERVEQHAPDYQSFKNAHAEVGARLAALTASAAGIAPLDCLRVQELIQYHEHAPEQATDAEAVLLGDADALSFFSLNSRGFSDYYSPEHTRKKVAYSLRRMSSRALDYLGRMKLSPAIQQHVRESGCSSVRVPRLAVLP
jgi:hypothetical protein